MKQLLIAALALLLVPAASLAQPPGGRGMGPRMGMMQNAARMLVEHRADLNLTDDQVTKLTEIGEALEQKNAPHRAAMREMREAGTTRRDMSQAEREAMRSRMEEVRANGQEARAQIKEVLSAEQQKQARELLSKQRPRRDRAGTRR